MLTYPLKDKLPYLFLNAGDYSYKAFPKCWVFPLDWAIPRVSTSFRTTLSTAARKGINLHLAKNLGVPARKSHLALPLPSSGQTQGVQSNPTATLARRHRGYLQSTRSMAWGLSGTWRCQEHDVVRNMHVLIKPWAVAERVPSSCSQLKEAALSWSQALDPIPSAHSAWGRGHKLQVFKPSHCHSENAPGSLRSQFFL